ncbi:hypothetical protein NDU88_000997 [Pleurodeles waltl]|uniref:Uncharacterized protein n=1 Tax=Pleurodeles waltl TaxID=8319 RepID=A0AAV7NB61_PLEWA|nr:hypothetical protein NDU88_000997 [Pleurodeles waltl]
MAAAGRARDARLSLFKGPSRYRPVIHVRTLVGCLSNNQMLVSRVPEPRMETGGFVESASEGGSERTAADLGSHTLRVAEHLVASKSSTNTSDGRAAGPPASASRHEGDVKAPVCSWICRSALREARVLYYTWRLMKPGL